MSTKSTATHDAVSSHRTSETGQQTGASGGTTIANDAPGTHTVVVYNGTNRHELQVEHGRTLRAALREHNLSPHGWLTRHLNCDGQGHCTACAVEVTEGEEAPEQWLDAFMHAQDLGRLSCQIDVTEDMVVRV
jgi:ferredoxin